MRLRTAALAAVLVTAAFTIPAQAATTVPPAAPARAHTLPVIVQHLPAPAIPAALGNAGTNLQVLGNGLCINYAGNRKGRLGEVLIQSSCRVSRPWRVYFNSNYTTMYFRPVYGLNFNIGQNSRGELILVKAGDAAHSRASDYNVIRTGKPGHYIYWFGMAFYPNKNEKQYDYWLANGLNNAVLYMFTVPPDNMGYVRIPVCDLSCNPQSPVRLHR